MKIVNKIFNYTILIALIWVLLNSVKPYWEKYWLETQLETAAIYGTKHSTDETVEMLVKKTRKDGYDFREDDFIIEKDPDNSVSIYISYIDSISLFGWTLKELDFIAEAKAFEATGY